MAGVKYTAVSRTLAFAAGETKQTITVQRRSSLAAGEWQKVGELTGQLNATVRPDGAASFFRVLAPRSNTP